MGGNVEDHYAGVAVEDAKRARKKAEKARKKAEKETEKRGLAADLCASCSNLVGVHSDQGDVRICVYGYRYAERWLSHSKTHNCSDYR